MSIHPKPDDPYTDVIAQMNVIFVLVFNIEAIMKLFAMHCNYFYDAWNCFDFVCVFVGDIILIIEGTVGGSELGTTVNTFRIFRIARLFRLVRFLKGLNQLVHAFMLSVPKLCNVGLILFLLLYLYAVLGINLFAKIGYIGGMHGDQAHFRSFSGAISVLVRSMTGEAWNEIMHELSKSQFDYESIMDIKCVSKMTITKDNFASLDLDNDGVVDAPNECGTWLAKVYFLTYTISVTFVILNLFIAVILDGFEESQNSEFSDIIFKCLDTWKSYDPECTMALPLERALDYIDEVVEELIRKNCDNLPKDYKMPRYDNMYTGEIKDSVHSWAYYNLHYMRILALRVGEAPNLEVRFVVCVKAVLRRIICQCVENSSGSLSYFGQGKINRLSNLLDLEQLDQFALEIQGGVPATEPDPLKAELAKLQSKAEALRSELAPFEELGDLDACRKYKEASEMLASLKKGMTKQDEELERLRKELEAKMAERQAAMDQANSMAAQYRNLDIFKLDVIANELRGVDGENELGLLGKSIKGFKDDTSKLKNYDEQQQMRNHGERMLSQCHELRALI